jgi:hypothetical protein
MRNEAPYLAEWIEYHHMLGVDHFWLFEHGSGDNWTEVLAPYVRDRLVTIDHQILSRFAQGATLEHCLTQHQYDADWIAFIDIDEFIAIVPPLKSLAEVTARFQHNAGLFLASKAFGPSGHFKRPNDLAISSYTRYMRCLDSCQNLESMSEAMVQGKLILNMKVAALEYCAFAVPNVGGMAHNCLFRRKGLSHNRQDVWAVDTKHRLVINLWLTQPPPPYDVAYVAHFVTRSCEEFERRIHQRREWIASSAGKELVDQVRHNFTNETRWIHSRINPEFCSAMAERASIYDGTLELWAPQVRASLAARKAKSSAPLTLEQHRLLHIRQQLEGIERRFGKNAMIGIRYVVDWLLSRQSLGEKWQHEKERSSMHLELEEGGTRFAPEIKGTRVLIAGNPPQYTPLLLSINCNGTTRVLATEASWHAFICLPQYLVLDDLVLPIWFPREPSLSGIWPDHVVVPSAVANAPWDALIMDFTSRFHHSEHQARAYELVVRDLYRNLPFRKPLEVFVQAQCQHHCNETLLEEGSIFIGQIGDMLHYRFLETSSSINMQNNRVAKRKRVPLAICGMFEPAHADQLSEWLDFHSAQGVRHAFLYENPKSEPSPWKPWRQIAVPFVAQGMLTLYESTEKHREAAQVLTEASVRARIYQECMRSHNKTARWLAFLPGLDHYLTPREHTTMVSALEAYQDYAAVVVNVLPFGPNGWVYDRPPASPGSFLRDYTMIAEKSIDFSLVPIVQVSTAPLHLCQFHSRIGVAMNCFAHSTVTVVSDNFEEQRSVNHMDQISASHMHVGRYLTRSCLEFHELCKQRSASFAANSTEQPEETWALSLQKCLLLNASEGLGGTIETAAVRFASQIEELHRWRELTTEESSDWDKNTETVSRAYSPEIFRSTKLTIFAHEESPCVSGSTQDLRSFELMKAIREAGHQVLPVFGRISSCTGANESKLLLDLGISVIYAAEESLPNDDFVVEGLSILKLVDMTYSTFQQIGIIFGTLFDKNENWLPRLVEQLLHSFGEDVNFVSIMNAERPDLQGLVQHRPFATSRSSRLCLVGEIGNVSELVATLPYTATAIISTNTWFDNLEEHIKSGEDFVTCHLLEELKLFSLEEKKRKKYHHIASNENEDLLSGSSLENCPGNTVSKWNLKLTPYISMLTGPVTMHATVVPCTPMLVEVFLDDDLLTLSWEGQFTIRLTPHNISPGEHVLKFLIVDWFGKVADVHELLFFSSPSKYLSPLSPFFLKRELSPTDPHIHVDSPLMVRTLLNQSSDCESWRFRYSTEIFGAEVVSADTDELSQVLVRDKEEILLVPLPSMYGRLGTGATIPRIILHDNCRDTLWAFRNLRLAKQSGGISSWEAEEALTVEKQSESQGLTGASIFHLSPVGLLRVEELLEQSEVRHAICLSIHISKAHILPLGIHFQFIKDSLLTEFVPTVVMATFRAIEHYGLVVCEHHKEQNMEEVYIFLEDHQSHQFVDVRNQLDLLYRFLPMLPWHRLRATSSSFLQTAHGYKHPTRETAAQQ